MMLIKTINDFLFTFSIGRKNTQIKKMAEVCIKEAKMTYGKKRYFFLPDSKINVAPKIKTLTAAICLAADKEKKYSPNNTYKDRPRDVLIFNLLNA